MDAILSIANGWPQACRYARAEGIGAMVLKRRGLKDTKKWANIPAYATFLNAGTNNDGYTPQGIMFPSSEMQRKLEEQVEFCGLGKNFPLPDHVCRKEHGTPFSCCHSSMALTKLGLAKLSCLIHHLLTHQASDAEACRPLKPLSSSDALSRRHVRKLSVRLCPPGVYCLWCGSGICGIRGGAWHWHSRRRRTRAGCS